MWHGYGHVPSEKGPDTYKNPWEKKEKKRSNFLVFCLLLRWHISKDHLEPMELATIKEPIHTHTHTQTKNGLHSRATRPKTIWNGLLTQKELLLGRDTAVLVNQYCRNRCLYHSLLFILHQECKSTWWSLGRKHNIANCFSRTEESRFMEDIAPKMHCNITFGVKERRNVCIILLTPLLTGQLFWRK